MFLDIDWDADSLLAIYSTIFICARLNYEIRSFEKGFSLILAWALSQPHHAHMPLSSCSLSTILPHCGHDSRSCKAAFQAPVFRFVPDGNSSPYFAAVSKEAKAALTLIPSSSTPATAMETSAFITSPLSRILSMASAKPPLELSFSGYSIDNVSPNQIHVTPNCT
jgi:hypothetical protein